MTMFAVRMINGPAYDRRRERREQDEWDEHAAFMDALVDEGFVVLGGPVGDGEQVLVAVEAQDEREVRERFAADPWHVSGVLKIGRVSEWTIWLDRTRRRSLA
jgi:uncharacterized protein YciI